MIDEACEALRDLAELEKTAIGGIPLRHVEAFKPAFARAREVLKRLEGEQKRA